MYHRERKKLETFDRQIKKSGKIAFTVAIGEEARRQAAYCEATFRYYHPDIPFFIIGENEYKILARQDLPGWGGEIICLRSLVGWFLSNFFERVLYLDTDLFVLGELEDLLERPDEVLLTHDRANYTMKVPELPILNSGVISVSNSEFWKAWTIAQYRYLLPALKMFYFNQLSLRLLVHSNHFSTTLLDENRLKKFYNVSVNDYPGDWVKKGEKIYRGDAEVKIFHQAGWEKRGLHVLPDPIKDFVKQNLGLVKNQKQSIKSNDLGQNLLGLAPSFFREASEMMKQIGLETLDFILREEYAKTPGCFRSAAPTSLERFRSFEKTSFTRIYQKDPPSFFYNESLEPNNAQVLAVNVD